MMIRKILTNTTVFMVSIVVALLLGEFLIRVAAPQKLYRFPKYMFVNHDQADYALAPNFHGVSKTAEYKTDIATNSAGIRDEREFDTEKPDRTLRIVAIGDSFTMGVGVQRDESFLALAEHSLSERMSEHNVEIVNLGVPGHRTAQSIALLNDKGLPLNPDIVILNFYVGNDITQNASPTNSQVVDGYIRGMRRSSGILPGGIRDFLQMNSHLYQLIWPIQRRIFEPDYEEKLLASQRRRFEIYSDEQSWDSDLWQPTFDLLAQLKQIAADADALLLVTVIPEDIQLSDDRWVQAESMVSDGANQYDRTKPMTVAMNLCERLELTCLNMLPGLLEPGLAAEEVYFQVDGHWTAEGNKIAGRLLADFVESNASRTAARPQGLDDRTAP